MYEKVDVHLELVRLRHVTLIIINSGILELIKKIKFLHHFLKMKIGWHEIQICLSKQATVSQITLTSQPDSTSEENRSQTSATDVGKLNT